MVSTAPTKAAACASRSEEVHRCLADGRTDSDVMPLDETLALMAVLDDVRAQIGLAFSG